MMRRFPESTVRILSLCQILVGIVTFALEASLLGKVTNLNGRDSYTLFLTGGDGFICGCVLVAAGILGLKAAKKRNLCTVAANSVLSFLSGILSAQMIYPTSLGVHILTNRPNYDGLDSLFATQLAFAVLALIVCLAATVVSGRAVCYIFEKTYGQGQGGPVGATGGAVASAPALNRTGATNTEVYPVHDLPPIYKDVEMRGGGGDKQDQRPRY